MGLVGMVVDEVAFDVERGKIREFVRATQASDPVHTDDCAAAAAGFATPLATATHVVVAGQHRDQSAFVAALGLDLTRIVVGSVRWTYARPLAAGDRLTGRREVIADETRDGSGGTMRLVTLETPFRDERGEPVVTVREVLIERPER